MGLLTGFTAVVVAIGCGLALAHAGVLDARSQRTLGEVAFRVAMPALLLLTIADLDLAGAGANLAASAVSLAIAATVYAVVARLRWRRPAGEVVVGSLAASYVNAGNLGIAFAAYVVGDIGVVVPTLLVQMVVVQPLALVVLDHVGAGGPVGAARVARRAITNPLLLAALGGILLAATGWILPAPVRAPLELLGGAGIPLMLLAYGAALRHSPAPGRAGRNAEVALVVVLKLAVMPAVAWLVGTALGLSGPTLLGVVLTAALPTAQNIFLHATRYRTGEDVARESILVTTVASLPVVLVVALLLG